MAIRDMIRRRQESEAPVVQEGWSPIAALQRDINRMFHHLWDEARFPSRFVGEEKGPFLPSVEITESDKEVEVSAELPGMSEKDLELSISADATSLTIKGEKKYETEKKHREYHWTERSYGAFRRTLPLPCPVQADRADARFKDGVLQVRLPKSPETEKVRHIPVKS